MSWYISAATLLVVCMASSGVGLAEAERQSDGSWQIANPDTARTSLRGVDSVLRSLPEGARVISFYDIEVEPPGCTNGIYEGVTGDLRIRFVRAGGSYFHGIQPDTTLPFAFYNSFRPNPSSKQTPPFALLAEASFTLQVLTPENSELGKFDLDGISAGSYWLEPSESGEYIFQIWYNGEAVHQPMRIAYVR